MYNVKEVELYLPALGATEWGDQEAAVGMVSKRRAQLKAEELLLENWSEAGVKRVVKWTGTARGCDE